MADSSARRYDFAYEQSYVNDNQSELVLSTSKVKYSLFEKALLATGVVVSLLLATLCISTSNLATATQSDLSEIQQAITTNQNKVTDLNQRIGELTTSSRLAKIAREQGLSLNESNIRTIR
ncbi:MAG: cell division protein FtsL [Lactobacillus sp.]|nr:cell division protein FtsL [Lactobacillus sp.]